MPAKPWFTPELFAFLAELRERNERGWFEANKARYLKVVRDPMLEFIAAFAPRLRRLSPHFVADPRPVGGSLFRIHRDVRFSLDKSPYKTNVGAWFRHVRGRDVRAPGFYLHLAPGEVFAGSGVWHPDGRTQKRIRDAIVADPRGWKRALAGKAFRSSCRLGGESLKRPPAGYDSAHPLIEDLKRKDFVSITPLDETRATAADFLDRFTEASRAALPLVRFLCSAVGVEL